MITMEEDQTLRRRMLAAGVLLLLVIAGGTFGYWGLSRSYLPVEEQWALGDCAYMTTISITTVGYGEIISVGRVPYARLLTVLIIFSGLGVAVYFASALTAFVVEGEFQQLRKRRRMKQQMAKVSGHIIVCGIGTSGLHVVTELLASRWQVVCIDSSEERVRRVHDLPGGGDALGQAIFDAAAWIQELALRVKGHTLRLKVERHEGRIADERQHCPTALRSAGRRVVHRIRSG